MAAATLPELLAAARKAATDEDRRAACWEIWRHCETGVAGMVRGVDRLAPDGVANEEFRESVRDRALDQLVEGGGFARVEADDAFWGFVRTTVRNAAISEYRRRMRRPRAAPGPPVPEDDSDEPSYRFDPPGPGTPETELRAAERTGMLLDLADQVAAGSRNGWRWIRAIRLRYCDDFTFPRIAAEMRVTERTAQRYVEQGQQAFRELLEQRGIALADLLDDEAPR